MSKVSSTVDAPPRPRRVIRLLPWAVILGWVVLLTLAVPLMSKLDGITSDSVSDQLPASAESTKAAALESTMPGGEDYDYLIVYVRDSGLTQADRDTALRHLPILQERFGDPAASLPNDGNLSVSPDGKAMFIMATVPPERGLPASYIQDIRDTVADRPAGLVAMVSGPGGIEGDLDGIFDGIDENLLLVTALVVTAILVLTYRSPLLWLIPLVSAGAAIVLSQAGTYLAADWFSLAVSDQNGAILIILVFGVGTDYALLLVARYREELRRHQDTHLAMIAALRRSAVAIAASAATVIAGLLCLLAADMNITRGLGPIAAVAILSSLVAMLSLFPALLVVLGRRVFWPRIPHYGDPAPGPTSFWARLGEWVSRHRVLAASGSVVLLGAMALGLLVKADPLRQLDQFVNKPESVAGLNAIPEHFPNLGGMALTVIGSEDKADELIAESEATPGVASAFPGRTAGGLAEINVATQDPPGTPAEYATIERLRERLPAVDPTVAVGGPSAQNLDVIRATSSDERKVIPLVLLVVALILGLLLRSIVAPVVLIITVVLSFAAALGLMTFLFVEVLGFPGLDPTLVVLGFLFLVALGIDYNIFLATRAREESARLGTARGVVHALTATGGVITSAGVVLAATFGALVTLPLYFMIELGLLVAFGVLLDALLVRSVLVPAIALLLDRWMWWPSALARRRSEDATTIDLDGRSDKPVPAVTGHAT